MKHYYCPLTCSEAVDLALAEGGIAYEAVETNIFGSQTVLADGSPMSAIHRKGYVPVLELDDGTRLSEVPAILDYISHIAEEGRLFRPNDLLSHTRQVEWLAFISSELHKGVSQLGGTSMTEEGRVRAQRRFDRMLSHVEEHLEKTDYLVGDVFGVADCFMALILDVWIPFTKIADLNPYPNINRYRARLSGRRHVKTVLERARAVAAAMRNQA